MSLGTPTNLLTMFSVGLVSAALALAPFVNAAAPQWGQVSLAWVYVPSDFIPLTRDTV